MKILGITAAAHNSSVALVDDGALLFFAEEERFNRRKNSGGFPALAVEDCLKTLSIHPSEIDAITLFNRPWKEITGNLAHMARFFPQTLNLLNYSPDRSVEAPLWNRLCQGPIPSNFRSRFPRAEIRSYEHHLCHAASSFLISPFKEAAILSLDGRGESVTTLLAQGSGGQIRKIHEIKVPHSLGHLYAAVTWFLGFRPFHDEWKVMGMAAYGNSALEKDFAELLNLSGDSFRLDLRYFRYHTHGQRRWFSELFFHRFGAPRSPESSLEQRHFDLARALQKSVEGAGVFLANRLYALTGSKKLCLSGGVALNCLMNSRILEETPFEQVFIPPFVHDAGTAAGSALLHFYKQHPAFPRTQISGAYLGHQADEPEIEAALNKHGLRFQKPSNLIAETVRLLTQGKIVAVFRGRMEAGPRALGNRSILADPRRPEMRDVINQKTKHREYFRPLAPVVLQEKTAEYFDLPKGNLSPFMLLTARARPLAQKLAPAVVHADGTARVQTIERDQNSFLHGVLTEFESLTGVPILINTSFNDQEPIVCRAEDAVNCFLRTKIDALVLEDYLLERE